MKVAAIILAAGQSRRMGSPKMLLPWGKTTVLGQVVETFASAGAEPIVVVSGAAREQVEGLANELAAKFPVRVAFNSQHQSGEMLSSLQAGLAALGPEVESALIGLGDQPQGEQSTARNLLQAFEHSRRGIIVPSFENRRGHPYLIHRNYWPEILSMQTGQTPRDFLNSHASEILYIAGDQSILMDLDTPEDYARYLKLAK